MTTAEPHHDSHGRRSVLPNITGWSLPEVDAVCDVFAHNFVRAVAPD
ncbi:hypothetical protein [Mycobacterium ahvazicum]|nr:hypothetical protein [Mycobacterium ahvazicum]